MQNIRTSPRAASIPRAKPSRVGHVGQGTPNINIHASLTRKRIDCVYVAPNPLTPLREGVLIPRSLPVPPTVRSRVQD